MMEYDSSLPWFHLLPELSTHTSEDGLIDTKDVISTASSRLWPKGIDAHLDGLFPHIPPPALASPHQSDEHGVSIMELVTLLEPYRIASGSTDLPNCVRVHRCGIWNPSWPLLQIESANTRMARRINDIHTCGLVLEQKSSAQTMRAVASGKIQVRSDGTPAEARWLTETGGIIGAGSRVALRVDSDHGVLSAHFFVNEVECAVFDLGDDGESAQWLASMTFFPGMTATIVQPTSAESGAVLKRWRWASKYLLTIEHQAQDMSREPKEHVRQALDKRFR